MLEVTITTAVPLTAQQLETIKSAVGKKHGSDVTYSEVVDASVLGGISLRIGSVEYDSTLSRKLDQVRSQLRATI